MASTFDGYPLAKQGRAGPALVMAAVALVRRRHHRRDPDQRRRAGDRRPSPRRFGPPELFLVVVAGLLTLIVIVGKNKLLGALSALIGFAIATVGIDIGTGQQRYTFGYVELINGIDFIPVAIGLFGVGEILYTLWRGGHLEKLGYFKVSARATGLLAEQAGLPRVAPAR